MQSIFRLPWCSDQLGPKLADDNVVAEKLRSVPVVDMPIFHRLKRKFSDGLEAVSPHPPSPAKKARPDSESDSQSESNEHMLAKRQTAHPNSKGRPRKRSKLSTEDKSISRPNDQPVPLSLSTDTTTMASPYEELYLSDSMTPLQRTIENQFNMQILMKHNELRLIEQELAKCQIALEQLRRCELRPYPGTNEVAASVSEGRGLAVSPPPGFSKPPHPAPYGVTDGPYSRHYQEWLLHDGMFDPTSLHSSAPVDPWANSAARSTRNHGTIRKSISKAVSISGRHSDSQHSLPNYPSAPVKDKSAPLVLKRSTDGQMVKLICNNCHRGNFSSIQGFLNHCRIAHKVDYKSHDLAAIDCGRPLDENEMANLPTESHTPAAPKPTVSRSATTVVTPARSNLVHPFITNSGASATNSPAIQRARVPVQGLSTNAPGTPQDTPLKPSTQVPRLSRLFAKNNLGGDLEEATILAKQKIDLGHDDLPSPDVSEQNSPIASMAGTRPFVANAHGNNGPNARPHSRKGRHPAASTKPRPAPLISGLTQDEVEMLHSPNDAVSSATFSPHTADSNPGLVSDHEDDDHGSASEEETPPQPGSEMPLHISGAGGRHCADHMEIDVEEDDEIDQHGVIIRRNSTIAAEARGMSRGAGSPSRKMGLKKGGK